MVVDMVLLLVQLLQLQMEVPVDLVEVLMV
jgi:hypothetical protein